MAERIPWREFYEAPKTRPKQAPMRTRTRRGNDPDEMDISWRGALVMFMVPTSVMGGFIGLLVLIVQLTK